MNKKKYSNLLLSLLCILIVVAGCKKKDYFIDTGTHNAEYNGTVFEYLQNHPYR